MQLTIFPNLALWHTHTLTPFQLGLFHTHMWNNKDMVWAPPCFFVLLQQKKHVIFRHHLWPKSSPRARIYLKWLWDGQSERKRRAGSHRDESYYTWEKKFFTSAAFLAGILMWRWILTQTFIATHFQVFPVTFIKYGQNVNKNNISKIKLFWGKYVGFM